MQSLDYECLKKYPKGLFSMDLMYDFFKNLFLC